VAGCLKSGQHRLIGTPIRSRVHHHEPLADKRRNPRRLLRRLACAFGRFHRDVTLHAEAHIHRAVAELPCRLSTIHRRASCLQQQHTRTSGAAAVRVLSAHTLGAVRALYVCVSPPLWRAVLKRSSDRRSSEPLIKALPPAISKSSASCNTHGEPKRRGSFREPPTAPKPKEFEALAANTLSSAARRKRKRTPLGGPAATPRRVAEDQRRTCAACVGGEGEGVV